MDLLIAEENEAILLEEQKQGLLELPCASPVLEGQALGGSGAFFPFADFGSSLQSPRRNPTFLRGNLLSPCSHLQLLHSKSWDILGQGGVLLGGACHFFGFLPLRAEGTAETPPIQGLDVEELKLAGWEAGTLLPGEHLICQVTLNHRARAMFASYGWCL